MTHKDIFQAFKNTFPEFVNMPGTYFSNGNNSIRVKLDGRRELIFTYHGANEWKLETVDNFVNELTGKRK